MTRHYLANRAEDSDPDPGDVLSTCCTCGQAVLTLPELADDTDVGLVCDVCVRESHAR